MNHHRTDRFGQRVSDAYNPCETEEGDDQLDVAKSPYRAFTRPASSAVKNADSSSRSRMKIYVDHLRPINLGQL